MALGFLSPIGIVSHYFIAVLSERADDPSLPPACPQLWRGEFTQPSFRNSTILQT